MADHHLEELASAHPNMCPGLDWPVIWGAEVVSWDRKSKNAGDDM
jgi:hypothetical protein